MLTEEKERDILECDKTCEKEVDFIFCFTRCLRKKGYYEDDVLEAIRYVLGLEI